MKFLIFITLIVCTFDGKAQIKDELSNNNISCNFYYDTLLKCKVYDKLDVSASYIGGEHRLLRFISSNLKLNEQEMMIGKIHIHFIVDESGKILKLDFGRNTLNSIKNKLKKIFEGNNNWIAGKCKDENVISIINFTFAW